MTVDYQYPLNRPFEDVEQCCTRRDTIIYTPAIGIGYTPVDEHYLRIYHEEDVVVIRKRRAVMAPEPGGAL